MLPETQQARQLTLPPFALEEKSQICFDPYTYLRQLVEKHIEKSDDTFWLQGDGFFVSVSLDKELDYQSTEIPPFIAITIWPNPREEWSTNTMIIYPHNPKTGETRNQYPGHQLYVITSDPFSPPPEIRWLSDEHQQAAKSVLFINNLVSK